MIGLPWQFTLFVLGIYCIIGVIAGILVSLGAKWILRSKTTNLFFDSLAGMIGVVAFLVVSAEARRYALEVNGKIMGWPEGYEWWGARPWVVSHEHIVAVGLVLLSISLSVAIRGRWSLWRSRKLARPQKMSSP